MPSFQAPACGSDDALCNLVEDTTGSLWLAHAADWLIVKPLALLFLIVLALVVRFFVHRLIDRLSSRAAEGLPSPLLRHRSEEAAAAAPNAAVVAGRRVQRSQTMGSMLKSVASIIIFTVTAITALAELGFPVGPLIASAGIVGVALGFGAQSLVKDFLSGVFMIFEDQYGVGDVVDVGEATGSVEAVGLRVSRLRDVEGTVWYVRNGEILRVGNKSQNWARTVIDVPVAHEEDVYRVQDVLREVAREAWEDEDLQRTIIEPPEVWGVEEMTSDWIAIRVTLKTAPLEQWAVAREVRERIKARFDHEGIRLARPARVLIQPPTGRPTEPVAP